MFYASLHTAKPSLQSEHEVAYKGYRRVPVDYTAGKENNGFVIEFPPVEEDSPETAVWLCIGSAEVGNGKIELDCAFPDIKLTKSTGNNVPRVIVVNEPGLPENLHPIARTAYRLWWHKQLDAATLHPKLYEAINDELHAAGAPVIPVVRQATATWDVTWEMLNGIVGKDS